MDWEDGSKEGVRVRGSIGGFARSDMRESSKWRVRTEK